MTDTENPIHRARAAQDHASPSVVTQLWEEAVEQKPDNAVAAIGFAKCLEKLDRNVAAAEYFELATARKPDNEVFETLRLRNLSVFLSPQEMVGLRQEACRRFPNSTRLVHNLAASYREAGDVEAALDLLKTLTVPGMPHFNKGAGVQALTAMLCQKGEAEQAYEFLLRLTKILTFSEYPKAQEALVAGFLTLSESEFAIERVLPHMRAIFSDNPGGLKFFHGYYRTLKCVGDDEEAQAARNVFRGHNHIVQRYESLQAVIDSCSGSKLKTSFDKAVWRVWRLTQKSEAEWGTWSSQVAWRNTLNMRCRPYFAAHPERYQEVVDMFVPVNISKLSQVHKAGKGGLIAASHQLYPMIFTRYAEANIPEFMALTRDAFNLICHDERHFSVSGSTIAPVRETLRCLKAGQIVTTGVDAPVSDDVISLPFKEGKARVSTLFARLAFRQNIPSFATRMSWNGEKFELSFVKLPDPEDGETLDAFVQRWCCKYWDIYVKVLGQAGCDFSVGSNVWKSLTFPQKVYVQNPEVQITSVKSSSAA